MSDDRKPCDGCGEKAKDALERATDIMRAVANANARQWSPQPEPDAGVAVPEGAS